MMTSVTWNQYRHLGRFLWPKGDRFLQIRVVICLIMLISTRFASVLAPLIYKWLINSLNETESSKGIIPPRWDIIIFYIMTKSLYGSGGYFNVLRSFLWLPVSQSTNKKLRVELFGHILNLSLNWHLQRKTGEVLRVIDRGVTSVDVILGEVVFTMLPAFADISIAIIFFISAFDVSTGLIIAATMVGYVGCTVILSKWKYHYRRERNSADNERQAVIVDAVLNFETVKYYSAEEWETLKYEEALSKHMNAEWSMSAAANLRQAGRKTMMSLGLAVGSLLCAWYVQEGKFTVGDYVLFVAYLEQVYIPLNSFGEYFKRVQQAFVDMENMFDILEESPDVTDSPDSTNLEVQSGKIEFQNVNFHYIPERPLLKSLSFTVFPGQTLALVGHSGAGKSTIVRLLLRFYNISSGKILIDGQDIRTVKQKSLREALGVVPQDTVLFNRDIEYNIRYGRPLATDHEIHEAAKSADIHKRILSFVDGYGTKVGERGLKLSGGEKQRVALARTVLKQSKIILLDEATSALDTKTERRIQASLAKVCKGKTTIIVAHRLSTIIHADQILVMEEGRVIESGTHLQLLENQGRYAEMWEEQLRQRKLSTADELNADDAKEIENVESEEDEEMNSETISKDFPEEGHSLRQRQNVEKDEAGIRYIPR